MERTQCLTSHSKAPRSVTQLSYGIPQYRVPRKHERPAAGKVEEQRVKARAQPRKNGNQVSHLRGQLEEPLMGGQFLVILPGTENQGSPLWGWGIDRETQMWAAKLGWANMSVKWESGENVPIDRICKQSSWEQQRATAGCRKHEEDSDWGPRLKVQSLCSKLKVTLTGCVSLSTWFLLKISH